MTKEQFEAEKEYHQDLKASVARLLELKGGNQLADIPLDSPYWDAQNVHNALYGGKKE